jgi:hypothetical protein
MLDLEALKAGAPAKYGRDRGTAFHVISEAAYKCESYAERLNLEVKDSKAKEMGATLYEAYKKATNPKFNKIAAELSFCVPIEGSPHSIAGRLDAILEQAGGKRWVGETKTASMRADLAKLKWEWQRNPQADFVLIGAESLGYKVEGVMVHTVKEAVPQPRVWPIEVRRTPQQLAVMKYNVHQTCEIIQMLVNSFGIDKPWPHMPPTFNPCTRAGYCDFEGDCGCVTLDDDKYSKRQEHLPVMTEKQWKN